MARLLSKESYTGTYSRSIGKPTDPAVLEFLNYILTTGQVAVASSGYCELNDVYIKNALDNLK